MTKIIKSRELTRELVEGAKGLCDTVSVTMGAQGANVLIDTSRGIAGLESNIGFGQYSSHITKDGVTVALAYKDDDAVRNMACDIIKEAAINTAREAGDGTTTAIVLATNIFRSAARKSNINTVKLLRELKNVGAEIIEELKRNSKTCGVEDFKNISLISSNGDETIGNLISDAFNKVDINGDIKIELSDTTFDSTKMVEGIQIESGMISAEFRAQNSNVLLNEFHDANVFMFMGDVNRIDDLIGPLEHANKTGTPLLIICNEIDPHTLQNLIINKRNGALNVCVIKNTAFTAFKEEELKDIQVIVGGKIFTHENVKSFTEEDLGKAEKIIVSQTSTAFFNKVPQEVIKARTEQIIEARDKDTNDFNKKVYSNRISRLNGICIIKIGAHSEKEALERKDRADDALCACNSARQEGILPGCGKALYNAQKIITINDNDSEELKAAKQILKDACTAPIKKICGNGHIDIDFDFLDENELHGYDLSTLEKIENLSERGIVDPTKVERVALENAISCAGILLTSKSAIIME